MSNDYTPTMEEVRSLFDAATTEARWADDLYDAQADALLAEGWRKKPSREALIQALDPSDADGRHLGKSHAGVVLHPRQAEAIADAILALMDGSNDE